LLRNGHTFFEGRRIMCADFSTDAVLQRRNNFSASGVVFRIRGEHEQDVKRQAERITLNLNITFLHDVEKADLNFAGEVGKFIDSKDAAVCAGQQSVVNGQLVGEIAASASGAN